MVQKCVHESARGVTRGGMNYHTGRFVYDDEVGVGIDDFDIQGLGLRDCRRRWWDLEGD